MFTHILKTLLAVALAISKEQEIPHRQSNHLKGLDGSSNRDHLLQQGFRGQGGGWANFLCPKDGSNSTGLLAECARDCMNNHAAVGGKCGDYTKGDFNCYCEGRSGFENPESLHCTDAGNERFTRVCEVDCMCDHGAYGGTCDWDLKACYCYGQGDNKQNYKCGVKTPPELAYDIENTLGKDNLRPNQAYFIKVVKSWTEDNPTSLIPKN